MPGSTIISDATLQSSLGARLKKVIGTATTSPPGTMDATGYANWLQVITDANQSATADLLSILQGRGYSYAQITAGWDYAASRALQQGLYYALLNGSMLGGYSMDGVNALDLRKQLASEILMIGGVPTPPPSPPAGGVGATVLSGRMIAADAARDQYERAVYPLDYRGRGYGPYRGC